MTDSPDLDELLEQGYNVRAAREDYDSLVEDWTARSEALRRASYAKVDIPYGNMDRQRLDCFIAGVGGPTLVYLHGGYWQRGDRSVYSFVSEHFVPHGVDVVVMGYTLCPDTTIPGITDEIRRGLSWLYRNGAAYGLDPHRINVAGHSAGGHLTAMMLATDWRRYAEDLPIDLVKSGVSISGIYDLTPLLRTSINRLARIDDRALEGCSPMFLSPASDAPVLAVVGGAETDAFHDQIRRFAARWSAEGAKVETYIEPGVDHFDVVNRLADGQSDLFQRVLGWLVRSSAAVTANRE